MYESLNIKEMEKIKAGLGSEYVEINKKLRPLILRVIRTVDKKTKHNYSTEKNVLDYYERFQKALVTSGKVISIQKLELKIEEPQLLSTIKLFHYLGLIESIGTTLVDMLVLLLVADGQPFHVERSYGLPRIVHAKNFEDLDSPNSTLGEKIAFLERNELEFVSNFVDRILRNKIAHLEFDIKKDGKIMTTKSKDVNIDHKISKFIKFYISFIIILIETGFFAFLESCIKEQKSQT